MSLQSERLLSHMLRLRLTHLPNCFEAIAEEASANVVEQLANGRVGEAVGALERPEDLALFSFLNEICGCPCCCLFQAISQSA